MKRSVFALVSLLGCDADRVSVEVESRGDGLTTVRVCFLPKDASFCELSGDEQATLLRADAPISLAPEPDGIIDFSDPLFVSLEGDALEGSLFDLTWSGFGLESSGFVTMPAPPEIISPAPGQSISRSALEIRWAAPAEGDSLVDIEFDIECIEESSRNLNERDLIDNGSYTDAGQFLQGVALDAAGCPADITVSRIIEGVVFDGQRKDSIRGIQSRTVSGVVLLP